MDYDYESILGNANKMLQAIKKIPNSPNGPSQEDNQTLKDYNAMKYFYDNNKVLFSEEQRKVLEGKFFEVSISQPILLDLCF